MAVTITTDHFAYPWKNGQTELDWMARMNTKTAKWSPISVVTQPNVSDFTDVKIEVITGLNPHLKCPQWS